MHQQSFTGAFPEIVDKIAVGVNLVKPSKWSKSRQKKAVGFPTAFRLFNFEFVLFRAASQVRLGLYGGRQSRAQEHPMP